MKPTEKLSLLYKTWIDLTGKLPGAVDSPELLPVLARRIDVTAKSLKDTIVALRKEGTYLKAISKAMGITQEELSRVYSVL